MNVVNTNDFSTCLASTWLLYHVITHALCPYLHTYTLIGYTLFTHLERKQLADSVQSWVSLLAVQTAILGQVPEKC